MGNEIEREKERKKIKYKQSTNKAAFTPIHFTNGATFAGVYTNPAAVFSLHFFICFYKYPLWYSFSEYKSLCIHDVNGLV